MIEATAHNFVRILDGNPHFRNVSYRSVPPVGRDRWKRALILYGEVMLNGRWIAFSSRSADQIWQLRRQVSSTGIAGVP